MKPMTFEEWLEARMGAGHDEWAMEVWDAARLGMIPEDEAARIDWSDPKLSTRAGIVILPVSQEHISTAQDVWGADKLYKYIPRPAPAWTPKACEKVFFHYDEKVMVGEFRGGDTIKCGGEFYDSENMKPFSPEKIGLKWEEI